MWCLWVFKGLLSDLCFCFLFDFVCLEQNLNDVFVVHVQLQILLHVLFEECFLVALFCWLFRLKSSLGHLPSKMLTAWISSISGWCGVFWLVKVIHQKVQAHRLWGGRVFAENIPKQSLVPPGSMLNLRVSEFS